VPAGWKRVRGGGYVLCLLLVLISLLHPLSSLRYREDYGNAPEDREYYRHMVVDERAYYYPNTGWLGPRAVHDWEKLGQLLRAGEIPLVIWSGIGFCGYAAGPGVYLIDSLALSDPLLARINPLKHEVARSGHFRRYLPRGYWDTLASGSNRLVDPHLATYYDRLRLVVSGPLLDRNRLREIARFTVGGNDGLLEAYENSPLSRPEMPIETPADKIVAGVFPPDNRFTVEQVDFGRPLHSFFFGFLLDRNRRLEAAYLLEGKVIARQQFEDDFGDDHLVKAQVPPEVRRAGFNSIQYRYLRGIDRAVVLPNWIVE
jgi:hypothetical protein